MSKDELESWPDEAGEPSGALGEALAIARQDAVSAAQVARLAGVLAPLYGLSITSTASAASALPGAQAGSASAAGSAASASLGTAVSVKLIAAALATVAIGTASLMSLRAPTRAPRPAPHAASSEAAPVLEATPLEAPGAPGTEPPRSPQARVPAGASTAPRPASASALEPAAPARKRRSHEDAPVEAQLLKEGHAALASDAARALRLADEHRARFPRGALAAERELLAVRALERLDRPKDAQRRIARARRELPRSAPVQRAAERLGAER